MGTKEKVKLLEMLENKDYYLNIIKEKWQKADDSFPDFLPNITQEIRATNDEYVTEIAKSFQEQLKDLPRYNFGRRKWKKKTMPLINEVLYQEDLIGLHKVMDQTSIDEFTAEIFQFLRHVRSFSPELKLYDIGQALRNYIVYVCFKKMHKVNSGFSMAAFGYSMLYPFTDNFIDNKNCTATEKQEYNQLIRNKIQGSPINPRTKHQRKTCELLQAIENDYPREESTGVYKLLLYMLEAQEISIKQQNKELPLTKEERLHISVYKGGFSVLIDRFFVHKEITEADFLFYLAFGYFLQLADDLQDVKEDSELGYSTLFTLDLHSSSMEALVNKMLHYLKDIMEDYQADNEIFKSFILNTSQLLILSSLIGSKEFFSSSYLERIYHLLPVSRSVLETYLDNQMNTVDLKEQKRYMKALDLLLQD